MLNNPLIEMLESRTLLSSSGIGAGNIPLGSSAFATASLSIILQNLQLDELQVPVRIENHGTSVLHGPLTIKLYKSNSRSVDGGTLAASTTRRVTVAPGHAKTVFITLSKNQLANLPPSGPYFLLPSISDAGGMVTEGAAVAAPTTAVGVSDVRLRRSTVRHGGRSMLSLTLTNTGTVRVSSKTGLNVTADGAILAAVRLPVRLDPWASRSYKVNFMVPRTLPQGIHPVTATLDVVALGDTNGGDGMATADMALTVT